MREEVIRHVDGLTPEDFERRVDMSAYGLGVWKGLDVFTLHGINHPRLHGGEFACLEGLQGSEGYTQASRAYP